MKWHIVTCDKTRHIVPAQQYLFDKYVPGADITYIDVEDEPIETWSHNVLKRLDTTDEYIIFGLDDFLPIDHFYDIPIPSTMVAQDDVDGMRVPIKFDRMELGWGGSRKGDIVTPYWKLFAPDELYRVSCQFSIWRTEALRDALTPVRTPWKFETKGRLDGHVYGLQKPWRYIEESALSGRQEGKVNLCGLRTEDIDDLIFNGLVDPDTIVYGWKGNHQRTKESYGRKYKQYY